MRLHLNCMEVGTDEYTPQVRWVKRETFEGKMVPVDNHLYEGCHFVNCNFLYSGGPFGFDECAIEGGFLSLSGAGRNVLGLLTIFQELERKTKGPY